MLQAFLFSEDVTNMKNLEESTGCAPMPGLWWCVSGAGETGLPSLPDPLPYVLQPSIPMYILEKHQFS